MYQRLIRQFVDLFRSKASKPEDDHLVGLNDPSSVGIGPSHDASNSENASSCRHDDLKQIKDQLTARIPSKLKIIPIVGMGGIGKTTLAKSIYEDTEISYHFYLRAWITVSQEYKFRNVLLGLLSSMGPLPDEVSELENEELVQMLYRSFKGRRFLIVLDDVWSTEICKDFKLIFPNDNNGSRIILTSRLMEVAAYADPDSPPHSLNCLSNDESWRLLCNEVFVGNPCPPNLVEIGNEIAKKCLGLPLAIVVVAGHLSNVDKNRACWADVEKGLDSLLTGNQEQILDILCLSYKFLPQHLKACFLYMGNFPKNSEICVEKLIRLWSAMGFLPSDCSENQEDAAKKCLVDLISRNLIMVRKKMYNGNGPAKTCSVHDLLRDLSLRECRKQGRYIFGQSNLRHSHLNAIIDDMKYLMSLTSTYFSSKRSFNIDFSLISTSFRLLRVLDIQSRTFCHFPDEITELVGLRYLELSARGNIPGLVSILRNLETLINNDNRAASILPKEIWLLRRLRHLRVRTCTFLPDASSATLDGSRASILPDLQTLTTLSYASCAEQVISCIPNLKRLTISEINGEKVEDLFHFLNQLVYLHRLEKLNLHFSKEVRGHRQIPWCDFFPASIKQLTLSGSGLPWEDMDILAMLPNLEVLKLKNDAFKGPVYEQTVEGFPRLKVLLLESLDLERWIAETIHFPVLQHLVLRTCFFLDGIPCCLGEIPTLESVDLYACSIPSIESANSIQQQQQSIGNYDLQVRIHNRVQKMVLSMEFLDYKIQRKAMKKVYGLSGVSFTSLTTGDKKLNLFGDIDPFEIAQVLRRVGPAVILSVGLAEVPQKVEAKEGVDNKSMHKLILFSQQKIKQISVGKKILKPHG